MITVKVENRGLAEGRYTNERGEVWTVARLIEHSKPLPVFDLPVAAIHIGASVFSENRTARDLAEHVKRVNEADFKYPVIMDPDGFIMDGWHRVIKALVESKETIKAVRFEVLPCYEFIDKK